MIITKTPFRISFLGGGTDYPIWYEKNGGSVLSTTIDKYCYVICRRYPPFFEDKVRMVWSKVELAKDADGIEHPTAREALNFLGLNKNIEIHHAADLPARSGLGASSSFTVGLLHALYALLGKSPSKKQLAEEAIHIERDRACENVGSQDQVAAAFGGFNKIIFNRDHSVDVLPLEIEEGISKQLQERMMLFFTGLSRSASDIAKAQIQNTSQKEKELRQMSEMVDLGIDLLINKKLDEFGELLDEAWKIKRELSHLITTSKIDEIYESAKRSGAIGGKLLGAGGGGFMLIYARPEDQERIKRSLSGFMYVPFSFESNGTHIVHHGGDSLIDTYGA